MTFSKTLIFSSGFCQPIVKPDSFFFNKIDFMVEAPVSTSTGESQIASQTINLRKKLIKALQNCPEFTSSVVEYNYKCRSEKDYCSPIRLSFSKDNVFYNLEVSSSGKDKEAIELKVVGGETSEVFRLEKDDESTHFYYENLSEQTELKDCDGAAKKFESLMTNLQFIPQAG